MAWIVVSPFNFLNKTRKYIVVMEKRWDRYTRLPIPGTFPDHQKFDSYAKARTKRNRLNGTPDEA